jgi:hypothetical protein
MSTSEGYRFANLNDWRTDPDKCRNGATFDLGLGRALIVRRANLFDREIQALFDGLNPTDTRGFQKVFANHLVVGWRGILDADGAPIPFSPDACLALFEYAGDVWDDLQRFAMNRANYRYTETQEDSEALKGSRDGATVQASTANS